jgi:hypothetical protein
MDLLFYEAKLTYRQLIEQVQLGSLVYELSKGMNWRFNSSFKIRVKSIHSNVICEIPDKTFKNIEEVNEYLKQLKVMALLES